MMLRLLVCGSRNWVWEKPLWRVLDRELARVNPADILLINGGARGADIMARDWAMSRQIDHMTFPARWDLYGRRVAGPMRNTRMLNVGQPNRVIAFHEEQELGRGTADMAKKARQALGPENVKIYRPPGWSKRQ